MERRKFLITSGTTILTGTSLLSLQKPALGLEFELSAVPNEKPSNIDSILVEFTNFEITPSYLDESGGLDITVELDIEREPSVTKTVSGVGFTNGKTIDQAEIKDKTGTDLSQVVIDETDRSGSNLLGDVYVRVNHPDVSEQTYNQSFEINQTNIIDDFKDGNFNEYSGNTSNANIVRNPVKSASQAAEILEGNNLIYSNSGDGLANYPIQGDKFRFNHNFPSDAIPVFAWGLQNRDNYYRFEIDDPNGVIRLIKRSSGSETILDSTSITTENNAWTETEVEWRTNGRMLIDHYDSNGNVLGNLGATDTEYSSGGVAWGEWSIAKVTSNLVAAYKINQGSGSVAEDVKNEYDGQINSAVWTTDSKTGNYALEFDGSGDNISIPNLNEPASTDSITLTAWVKTTDLSNSPVVISNYEPSWHGYWIGFPSTDVLRFYLGNSSGSQVDISKTGLTIDDGNWHFIAGVFDGSNWRLNFDNSVVQRKSTSHNIGNSNGSSYIGQASWDSSRVFNGIIDECRIYDRALSESEVSEIYNNTI